MTKILSNIIWKKFKVKTIFPNIEKCKCGNAGSLEDGRTPYVGATNRNNGTMRYVKASEKLITKGNCIVFICDGQGSVGYSIYKAEDFVGSTTLKVGRNKFLNYYNAQFIIGALDKNRCIYSYGYKRTEPRLKNETIYLPVNSKGEPDYEFMEEYIKEREEKLKQRYQKDVTSRVMNLQHQVNENKNWGEFKIKDIFSVMVAGKSKGLNHLEQVNRNGVPYLGATNRNNGVLCFVKKEGNEKLIQRGNCIAFIRNGEGSMGYSIYKAEDFIATSDITLGYNNKINKYSGMFITTIADRVRGKYSFNYKRSDTRLQKEILSLPVNSKGEPDYKYMEDYMKYLEQKKLLEYLEYIK